MTEIERQAMAYSNAAPFLRELRQYHNSIPREEWLRIRDHAIHRQIDLARAELRAAIERKGIR